MEVADQYQDAGAGVAAGLVRCGAGGCCAASVITPELSMAVVANAVVTGVDRGAGGDGFRPSAVGLVGSAPVQSAVRPGLVGVAAEGVQERLELAHGDWSRLAIEPLLHSLMEALHLPAGLRMVGAGVDERDAAGVTRSSSSATRPPRRGRR